MVTQETQTPQEIEYESKPIRCWTVAIWAAVIALLAMLPTIVQYKGLYIIRADYSVQAVPRLMEAKRLLTTSVPLWSHNIGLGMSGSVLLYGSPFFWLLMLFPEQWMPWVTGYSTVLIYAVAACSSFLALKMFVSSRSAAIGALLYTFSGYFIISNGFHAIFTDTIALFPLLIIGAERVLRKANNGFIALTLFVALNVLASYYLFVASSVFFGLYMLFRVFSEDILRELRLRLLITAAASYLLGIGLASFVLFPKIFVCVIECARAGTLSNLPCQKWIWFDLLRYLELTRVFFMPSESMIRHPYYPGTLGWTSTGIFLPVFGFTLVLMYLVKYRDWLSRLLIACLIASFVPIFNAAFSGFSNLNYTRWWFALSFILTLATVKILDERRFISSRSLSGYFLISMCICAVLSVSFGIVSLFPKLLLLFKSLPCSNLLTWWFELITTDPFMGGKRYVYASWLLCLLNYILLWVALHRKIKYRTLVIFIGVAASLNLGVFIELNNREKIGPAGEGRAVDLKYFVKRAVTAKPVLRSAKQRRWRIDHPHEIWNYGRFINANSINMSYSIRNSYSAHFEELTESVQYSEVTSLLPFNRPALRSLLSVKYFVNYDPEDFKLTMPGYKFVKETAGTEIYENEYYVPMGLSYDTYISENQMAQYKDCIEKLMLKAVVLSDEQIEKYGDDMHKFASGPAKCDDFDWMADALEMKKHACTDYTADSKGFAAKIELDAPRMVFFSIPYGAGWSAFVDGKPAQIEKVNIGFLGLMLPAGQHNIEFRYFPPGLKLGAIVSGISAIILLCYFIISARMSKRKAGGELAA